MSRDERESRKGVMMTNPNVPQSANGWGSYPQGQQSYGGYDAQSQQAYSQGYYQGAAPQTNPQGTQGTYGAPQQGYGGYGAQPVYGQGYNQGGVLPMRASRQATKSIPLIVGAIAVVLLLVAGVAIWKLVDSGSLFGGNGYKADLNHGTVRVESTNIEIGPLDEDGKPTVVITYSISNNGSRDVTIPLALPDAKQNGDILSSADYRYGNAPRGYDFWSIYSVVEPGDTKTVVTAFTLNNENDPVTLSGMDFDDPRNDIPDYVWYPR